MMKQNILLNSFQGIYCHALRFYVTTMWTSCMSNTSPGSNRNGAVPAMCCLRGIKKLDFYWQSWRALQWAGTFCCHARDLKLCCPSLRGFPVNPQMGMAAGRCFSRKKQHSFPAFLLSWWQSHCTCVPSSITGCFYICVMLLCLQRGFHVGEVSSGPAQLLGSGCGQALEHRQIFCCLLTSGEKKTLPCTQPVY